MALVFVYGTLKQGFYNHYLISGNDTSPCGEYVEKVSTYDPFILVVNDLGIPFLLQHKDSSAGNTINGEVYKVGPELLSDLDILEGVPDFYERHEIDVQNATGNVYKAFAYIKSNVPVEENEMLIKQKWYKEYTMELHAPYCPPPMRNEESWKPQMNQMVSFYNKSMFDQFLFSTTNHKEITATLLSHCKGRKWMLLGVNLLPLLDQCIDYMTNQNVEYVSMNEPTEILKCKLESQLNNVNFGGELTTKHSNPLNLEYEPQLYSTVICLNSIYHIPRILFRFALLSIAKNMQPNGILLLGLSTCEKDEVNEKGEYISQFTQEKCITIAKESGFQMVEMISSVDSHEWCGLVLKYL